MFCECQNVECPSRPPLDECFLFRFVQVHFSGCLISPVVYVVVCLAFGLHTQRCCLAESIFESLQEAIKSARAMGDALRITFNEVVRVTDDVAQFGNDSLIRLEVIALGVLVLLSPGVTEAMGFKEGEITRGTRLLSLFNIASLPDC